jgi:hypothetical protein
LSKVLKRRFTYSDALAYFRGWEVWEDAMQEARLDPELAVLVLATAMEMQGKGAITSSDGPGPLVRQMLLQKRTFRLAGDGEMPTIPGGRWIAATKNSPRPRHHEDRKVATNLAHRERWLPVWEKLPDPEKEAIWLYVQRAFPALATATREEDRSLFQCLREMERRKQKDDGTTEPVFAANDKRPQLLSDCLRHWTT